MFKTTRRKSIGMILAAPVALTGRSAWAQDALRIGKSVPNSWAFSATDMGIASGIFGKENINLSISAFKGDAQMQTGFAAGAVDVGLGSGPGLGFRAKGVPAIGVAAMYGPPANLAIVVLARSSIHTIADLKGKRVGVTTAGSLTDWLSRELARQQGWGRDGMQVLPLGSVQARLAAMERNDLDALVIESATGFELEELKRGRIITHFGDIAKHFYTHVIYASDAMVQKRPEVLRRFLQGWFRTIAYMRANKAETVKITAKVIGVRESIVSRVYDSQIGGFSGNGAWDPVAIDVIRKSLKELGILDSIPEARTLYNDQFVPVKL